MTIALFDGRYLVADTQATYVNRETDEIHSLETTCKIFTNVGIIEGENIQAMVGAGSGEAVRTFLSSVRARLGEYDDDPITARFHTESDVGLVMRGTKAAFEGMKKSRRPDLCILIITKTKIYLFNSRPDGEPTIASSMLDSYAAIGDKYELAKAIMMHQGIGPLCSGLYISLTSKFVNRIFDVFDTKKPEAGIIRHDLSHLDDRGILQLVNATIVKNNFASRLYVERDKQRRKDFQLINIIDSQY